MFLLENQDKGFWELQASTPAEWGFINNLSRALHSGDAIAAKPQEGLKEVTILLSPANGFPKFTPQNFIFWGTTNADKKNMRLLGKLVYEAKGALFVSEIFPNQDGNPEKTSAPSIRLCGAFCSVCAGPIGDPKLLDDCLCASHFKQKP